MSEFDRDMLGLNFTREEIFRSRIGVNEILALQAVAMGVVHKRARTQHQNSTNNQHGFAFYDRFNEESQNHMFLSGLVRKVAFDQWRMRLSLLHWDLEEEARMKSVREDYHFDWLKNGNCQAWYAKTAREVSRYGRLDVFTEPRMPIETIDCEVLAALMINIVDNSQDVKTN